MLNDWRWTTDQQKDIDDLPLLIQGIYNALNRLIAANRPGRPGGDDRAGEEPSRRPATCLSTQIHLPHSCV